MAFGTNVIVRRYGADSLSTYRFKLRDEHLCRCDVQSPSTHVVLKSLKVAISLLEGTVGDDDDDVPPGGKTCVAVPSIWSSASSASYDPHTPFLLNNKIVKLLLVFSQ